MSKSSSRKSLKSGRRATGLSSLFSRPSFLPDASNASASSFSIPPPSDSDSDSNDEADLESMSTQELQTELKRLDSSLQETRSRIVAVSAQENSVQTRLRAVTERLDVHASLLSGLEAERRAKVGEMVSALEVERLHRRQLESLLSLHPLNDSFAISHSGSFGTINGFRLGRLTTVQVDWLEINAALGLSCHLLATFEAMIPDLIFSSYKLQPCGSYSRVKSEGGTIYNLFSDGQFHLFGKRSLNGALKGFLTCLHHAQSYIREQDRTLSLPYSVTLDKSGTPAVGGEKWDWGDDEQWTRVGKWVLVDLKWLVAFVAKHYVA